jgi:hypothetical protein
MQPLCFPDYFKRITKLFVDNSLTLIKHINCHKIL